LTPFTSLMMLVATCPRNFMSNLLVTLDVLLAEGSKRSPD
jgi:hypothetical protein